MSGTEGRVIQGNFRGRQEQRKKPAEVRPENMRIDPAEIPEELTKALNGIKENASFAADLHNLGKIPFSMRIGQIQDKIERIMIETSGCRQQSLEREMAIVGEYINERIFNEINNSHPVNWGAKPAYYRALCLIASERAREDEDTPDPTDPGNPPLKIA